jgi:hypothetical protein
LYFILPKEYEQWKEKVFPKLPHEGIEKLAKGIFEKHQLPTFPDFPRFKWNEGGEPVNIALGSNCACVGLSKDAGNRSYHFHNVDHSPQAMAALEILSRWYNWIISDAGREKSKDP